MNGSRNQILHHKNEIGQQFTENPSVNHPTLNNK